MDPITLGITVIAGLGATVGSALLWGGAQASREARRERQRFLEDIEARLSAQHVQRTEWAFRVRERSVRIALEPADLALRSEADRLAHGAVSSWGIAVLGVALGERVALSLTGYCVPGFAPSALEPAHWPRLVGDDDDLVRAARRDPGLQAAAGRLFEAVPVQRLVLDREGTLRAQVARSELALLELTRALRHVLDFVGAVDEARDLEPAPAPARPAPAQRRPRLPDGAAGREGTPVAVPLRIDDER